jgi:CRP-like cAMP-binding protein
MHALCAADAAELERLAQGRRFAPGDVLLRQEVSGDTVAILLDGFVKLTATAGDDREVVLAMLGPGELVGELTAIDGGRRTASVIALTPGRAGFLSAEEMRCFLVERPYAALALMRTLTTRLRDADRARLADAARDGLGKVAIRLLELAERHGECVPEGVRIELRLTQDDLASWTCTSRQTVARALRSMRQLGWVATGRRAITLLDLKALQARAGIA